MMTGAATHERGKRLVRGAAFDKRSKMNSLWAFGWKQGRVKQREMKRKNRNILVINLRLQSYPSLVFKEREWFFFVFYN